MALKTMMRVAAVVATGVVLASCQDEMQSTLGGAKATRPLKPEVLALMESKGMRKEDPILVRTFKQENTLEIWKRDRTGHYAMLKSYPMCAWGGTLGPKIKEGDKQSPEGFYTVTPGRMNPHSQFHLAYDVGYPNAFDRAFGRTGAAVMVHGGCTGSAGCFVMTNDQVEEIYGLAREAFAGGQRSFQLQSYPFHMTAENLAKNRRNPNLAFWKNIKQGYDHFEVTKLEPKVDVCNRKYVFDARTTDPNSTAFNANGACPAFEVPSEIATRVAEKEKADDQAFKVAVAQLDDADRREAERLVAEKLEKSKPAAKPAGTAIAGWFGGATGDEVAMAVPPTPIDVPVPRVSPLMTPTKVAYAADPVAPAERSFADRLLSFGAPAPTAAPVAAVAPASEATAAGGQPIVVPVPSARPGEDAAVLSTASAAPAPAPASQPLWKRLNPFGG